MEAVATDDSDGGGIYTKHNHFLWNQMFPGWEGVAQLKLQMYCKLYISQVIVSINKL